MRHVHDTITASPKDRFGYCIMPVMRVSETGRIPPPSERLEFARNAATGAVHIVCYGPDRHWVPVTRKDNPEGTAVLNLISSPCRMLCGARLFVSAVDGHQAVWASGDHFADDDLCIRCVQALGDQQWRAFHVDNRGPS